MKKIILPLILILSTIQLIGQTVLDPTPEHNKEYCDSIYGEGNYVVMPIMETEEDLFRDGTSTLNLVDSSVPYYFDQSDRKNLIKGLS